MRKFFRRSYVIFDYINPKDFEFTGVDISRNKMVIGHRDASGWIVDKQAVYPGSLKSDTWYNVMLGVNGLSATMTVGTTSLSSVYGARIVDGTSYGLNWGLVGFGSNNARGAMFNGAATGPGRPPPAVTAVRRSPRRIARST